MQRIRSLEKYTAWSITCLIFGKTTWWDLTCTIFDIGEVFKYTVLKVNLSALHQVTEAQGEIIWCRVTIKLLKLLKMEIPIRYNRCQIYTYSSDGTARRKICQIKFIQNVHLKKFKARIIWTGWAHGIIISVATPYFD